jgi:uncharacterized protein
MSLSNEIATNMKNAMKAKDNATLSTLRLLRSALKNKEIDLRHELSDEEVLAVIKSQVKQLKDSFESFSSNGRNDLADGVKVELAILETYMPAQMSDEELEAAVEKAVADSGATTKADMGKAMGAAVKAVAGGADGNRVKAVVQQLLAMLLIALVFPPDALAAIPIAEEGARTSIWVEGGLRAFRVLILFLGIAAVMNILKGGFGYMTSSMRDDKHAKAISSMSHGVIMTMIVAGLFSIATIYLKAIV